MLRPAPRPTLFPYTTLFRSLDAGGDHPGGRARALLLPGRRADAGARRRPRAQSGDDRRPRLAGVLEVDRRAQLGRDRKSTRLNSSHVEISYAVFCLKKKKLA